MTYSLNYHIAAFSWNMQGSKADLDSCMTVITHMEYFTEIFSASI